MSNPFTAPTLSGYNATPPDDDGSQVSTNALKWSNHIDKIGDPLRAYALALSSATSAAFGLTLGQTYSQKSSNYTVLEADRGTIIEVTATAIITLPAAATAGDGFPLLIVASGAATQVTIDGDGSETINGATTVTLLDGQSALITCNGTAWVGSVTPALPSHTVVKTAVENKTADTTLADDSELTLNLAPDRRCKFTAHIGVGQNLGDLKYFFQFSNSPQSSLFGRYEAIDQSGVTAQGIVITISANTITTMTDTEEYSLLVTGHLQTNATIGGTVDFQWAQNTSSANATYIKPNSWMKVEYLD